MSDVRFWSSWLWNGTKMKIIFPISFLLQLNKTWKYHTFRKSIYIFCSTSSRDYPHWFQYDLLSQRYHQIGVHYYTSETAENTFNMTVNTYSPSFFLVSEPNRLVSSLKNRNTDIWHVTHVVTTNQTSINLKRIIWIIYCNQRYYQISVFPYFDNNNKLAKKKYF